MFKKLRKYSVAGFSLVELMVVVAIIGILAAVAIPNFNRFQRQARQAEAKTILTGIYNANKSFFAEWEGFTSDLTLMGYSADGQLRTDTLTASADAFPLSVSTLAAATFASRSKLFSVLAECTTKNPVSGAMWGNCALNPALGGTAPTVPAGVAMTPAAPANATNFTLVSGSTLGGTNPDQWSMDQNKTLIQTKDGID